MKEANNLEDRIVLETLEARESLLKAFAGNAHLYFVDAMSRDRAQVAAGRTRTGKTKDAVNPGQGSAPMRDSIMDELYAAKDKLSLDRKENAV